MAPCAAGEILAEESKPGTTESSRAGSKSSKPFATATGARSMVAIIREDLTLRVIGAKVGIVIRKVEDLNGKINDMKAKLVYLNIQISNIKCKVENHND
jgi:hypothetical protein